MSWLHAYSIHTRPAAKHKKKISKFSLHKKETIFYFHFAATALERARKINGFKIELKELKAFPLTDSVLRNIKREQKKT